MALIREIPKRSVLIPTVNRFSANFNFPAVGQYDFGVAANIRVPVFPAVRGMVYWLDRISFTATADEGVYLSAISTMPLLDLIWEQDGTRIFARSFPLVNYRDGQEINTVCESTKGNEQVLATVSGVLNQVPALVGVDPVTIQISLEVYQVFDLNWINAWRDNTRPDIGKRLIG